MSKSFFRPVTYTYRSIPYSTECTCHFGRIQSPRLADAEERILIDPKRFASFNPRTSSRRRRRRWFRCGWFRCGWFRRRGFRCGWFRRRRFGRGWSRYRGFGSGRFRCGRGRWASLQDFHKLVRECVVYYDCYAFTLGHTVRN